MIKTLCPVCSDSNNFKVLYEANFSKKDLNSKTFSARRLPDRKHYRIVQCLKDGMVRSNPVAASALLEKLYRQSKFTYEQEERNLCRTYLNALNEVLDMVSKKDRILEIGCGNGFMLKALWDLGYKNVSGIEPSLDAVSKSDKGIKRRIKVSFLKKGIFENKSFKLIFMFQTFDHMSNPGFILEECHKLLKSGGFLLIFNHDIESLSAKLLKESSPVVDIEHTYFYSLKTIKILLLKYNFKPVKAFSAVNVISLKHLIWLTPFLKPVKEGLLKARGRFLDLTIPLKLGNLCIIAEKF